ncbi:hypothetical protein CYMTET_30559, partial [Cymbomonas tetramitiformis]
MGISAAQTTTLGNLGEIYEVHNETQPDGTVTNITSDSKLSLGMDMTLLKKDVLVYEAYLDLLAISLFTFFLAFIKKQQEKLAVAVDEQTVTISDYTVELRGLPRDVEDKEEVAGYMERFGK